MTAGVLAVVGVALIAAAAVLTVLQRDRAPQTMGDTIERALARHVVTTERCQRSHAACVPAGEQFVAYCSVCGPLDMCGAPHQVYQSSEAHRAELRSNQVTALAAILPRTDENTP